MNIFTGYHLAYMLANGHIEENTELKMYFNDVKAEFEDGIFVKEGSLWAIKDDEEFEIGNSILTDNLITFSIVEN